MKDFLWTPVIPWPLIALGAAAALAGIAWTLWRGLKSHARALLLAGFRLLALAVIVLMMLQPQKRYDEVTILKPQLAVLIDASESMTDPVDEAQPNRAARVQEWLASSTVAKARESFDLRLFSFDSKITELPTAGKEVKFLGGVSNIVGALTEVQQRFTGQPLAGIALLTDGLDTTGQAPAAAFTSAVPVFTFELEKEFTRKEAERRVSLGSLDYPARVVVGWDSEIKAGIVGFGMSGRTITVELWREGKKEKEANVSFNEEQQTRPVAFPLAPVAPGIQQYELRVTDPAADKDAQAHPFIVEALPPGKRLLYLQNTLGFDFKFLRRAIQSDRNLQLSAFVRWGDGRIVSMGDRGQRGEANLDFSQAGLAKYSVVILGDVTPDALKPEDYAQLKEFVNRGGGLVLIGGPNQLPSPALAQTALGELSPVGLPAAYQETPAPVFITDAGLRHPVFGPLFADVKDFPPLLTINTGGPPTSLAEVLVEAEAGGRRYPLVAAQRFGQGRVVDIMTDTIWRWRLAAKSWSAEKSPYDTFWTQLMDWLIPKEADKGNSNKLELFTERSNYLLGERPEVRAIVRLVGGGAPPATLPIEVRTPDAKIFKYTLKPARLPTSGGGQIDGYRADVEPNVPGVFAATSSVEFNGAKLEGEVRFVVSKPVTELTSKPIDRDLLKRIAEASGGQYYKLTDIAAPWTADLHFKQQQFSRMQLSDLWNNPALLAVLIGLLAGDWVLRKIWNLP